MNPATGYYSLIQYCPDRSRLEAANVGVLLFSPTHAFLKARTARDNRRIRQFFGSEGHDWLRLNSFKQGLEERLDVEQATLRTLHDLEQFIAKRANRLRLTPPRPTRVQDPDKNLDQLVRELVGGRPRSAKPARFTRYLGRQFARAGLARKLRTDIEVPVPAFGSSVSVPYGYQNGRFHLIQPAHFQATDPVRVIPTACRYAVEGRSLYKHPHPELGELQLLVFGQFPSKGSDSKQVVQPIFTENKVRLYASNELDRLIEEIRRTVKNRNGDLPEDRAGESPGGSVSHRPIGFIVNRVDTEPRLASTKRHKGLAV